MSLPALATVADAEWRLGRALAGDELSRLEALLRGASASARSYAGGQEFTLRESTVRLRAKTRHHPRSTWVVLPQRPVVSIDEVEVDGAAATYEWDDGDERVYLPTFGPLPSANGPSRWPRSVTVTYEHGYEEIPDDVVEVVCNAALRAFGMKAEDAGLQSESLVNYSHTTGAAAAQGAVGLLAGERAILDRYKLPASPIAVL